MISALTGHKAPRTTFARYSKTYDNMKQEIVDAIRPERNPDGRSDCNVAHHV